MENSSIAKYMNDKTQACNSLQELFCLKMDGQLGDELTLDSMDFINYLDDLSDNAKKSGWEIIGELFSLENPREVYDTLAKKFPNRTKLNLEKDVPNVIIHLLEIDKIIYTRPHPEAHYSTNGGRINYISATIINYFSTIGKLVISKASYSDNYFAQNKLNKVLDNMKKYVSENNPWEAREPKEDSRTLEELMNELNSLTGLKKVKEEVNSLINLVKIRKLRKERNLKQPDMSLHMVFTGNPGTGKTTVARLLALIYRKLEILSKGQFVECDRSSLVAGYVGQTAKMTSEVIAKAIGGILFIDEAYSLTQNKGANDFGGEAVETLLKMMEDNRDDLVVIVAGYPDLMEGFLTSNPGLKSRFNRFIHFEDYKPDELLNIFISLCKKNGLTPTNGATKKAQEYFKVYYEQRDENYSNARGVRNYFELAVTNQANRLGKKEALTDKELTTLTMEDVKDIKLL